MSDPILDDFAEMLPQDWMIVSADERTSLLKELRRELPSGHVLVNHQLVPLARCPAQDDVLVRAIGASAPLWRVHLTWRAEWNPSWPHAEPFQSVDEFVRGLEREEPGESS